MMKIRGIIPALMALSLIISCSDNEDNQETTADEGTRDIPVEIKIDEPILCKIGKTSEGEDISYYEFHIAQSGGYSSRRDCRRPDSFRSGCNNLIGISYRDIPNCSPHNCNHFSDYTLHG